MWTNCQIAEIDDFTDDFSMTLGSAIYYRGDFEHPWFFDSPTQIMVRDFHPAYIHFKTINNEIYQFRLEDFHSKESLLLTSTLGDTFWFFLPHPSIERTMHIAIKGRERYSSKTSISGYVCWGNYFDTLLLRLQGHMETEDIEFPADKLDIIAHELKRRREIYGRV